MGGEPGFLGVGCLVSGIGDQVSGVGFESKCPVFVDSDLSEAPAPH